MTIFLCTDGDIGMAPSCCNCDDSSWHYRGEQPIYNERGLAFCDTDCLDEFEHYEAVRLAGQIRCAECGLMRDLDGCMCPGGTQSPANLRYERRHL